MNDDSSRVLAVITARGGSKGVPRKNIYPIQGIPLIAWTILAARQSKHIDRIVLSSDDPEIIAVARQFGCEVPFVRPAALATDNADSAAVVAHAIDALDESFDLVVLLQPTSPLRKSEDIDASIELITESGAPSVISVCEVDKSPYWMYTISDSNQLVPLINTKDRPTRRQDAQPVYVPNGAVYIVRSVNFKENRCFVYPSTRAWIMPVSRSIDIDTEDDLRMFEYLCEKHPELVPTIEE